MNNFLRFCSIVSIIIVSIKLAMIGNLTPGTVVFIIVCSLLILLGNPKIYIITAAVAGIVLFVKLYGGDNTAGLFPLLQSLLILAAVVFGLYIMLRRVFPSR